MQFLVLFRRITERFSDADFAPLIDAEVEHARQLYMDGFIRQIWHRADVKGACLLVEAPSLADVQATLQTLPLVSRGMLEIASLVPLQPYRGFAPHSSAN